MMLSMIVLPYQAALAEDISKSEFGFSLVLPDRWTINEKINGYFEHEFGGSYQLAMNDDAGSANILLLGVDAQPSEFGDIDNWMKSVILSKERQDNLLDWYGSYVVKDPSMTFDGLQYGEAAVGSGQVAKTVAPKNLRFGESSAYLTFVYLPSKTGDRWFCVVIYNKGTRKSLDADVPFIRSGLSLM
jgi:hypothetical protein